MKKTKTKKWFTAFLMAGALWMNGQTSCTVNPCTSNPPPACEWVCNGSFEISNGYPTKIADASFDQVSIACGWQNANLNTTPDYYHASSTASNVQIPCNINGKEQERTSQTAYAGLLVNQQTQSTWHERIAGKLKGILNPNATYEVSFWISLAENSTHNEVNNFGFTFTDNPTMYPNQIITFNTSNVTRDTWTKFTYTYSEPAMNWADMIVIGNFADKTSNTQSFVPVSGGTSTISCPGYSYTNTYYQNVYYFIDDVSVKEILPINVVASSTTGCTGESFTLTASGASTYTWNPGGLTGASVVVTPTAPTVYTVTATGAGVCVISPVTVSINPASCCTNTNTGAIHLRNVTLMAYNTPTTTARPWSSLTAGNYYTGNIAVPSNTTITNNLTVLGSLNINTPVKFLNSNIAINEDVYITQNNYTEIINSYLYGCDKLWGGINSKARISIKHSAIEDAFSAINTAWIGVNNHGGVIIDDAVFNKNDFGLIVGTNTVNPTDISITGAIFTSRNLSAYYNFTNTARFTTTSQCFPLTSKTPAKLKGSTSHSITANTIRANIGVYTPSLTSSTSTINIPIGAATTTAATNPSNADLTNYFDYLNEAVYNFTSRLFIKNCVFSNIKTLSGGVGTSQGAIYHDDGPNNDRKTETIIGANGSGSVPTSNLKCVFNTVDEGVVATNGGSLTVNYNDFNNVSKNGVRVFSWNGTYTNSPTSVAENVLVASNSFTDAAYVFYGNNNASIRAAVTSNALVHVQGTYSGFYNTYINETGKPASAQYTINLNNFVGSLNGVYFTNSANSHIINNNITVKKPGTGVFNAPIWLDNSDNMLISDNTVKCNPTNSNSWYTFGIFTNAAKTNTYQCNTITQVGAAMKYQGDCYPSYNYLNSLNNNSSDPCLFGVMLDVSGKTGNIGYLSGTTWYAADNIWGDFLYGTPNNGADTYCQGNSNLTGASIYYDNSALKPAALYCPNVNLSIVPSVSYTPIINTAPIGNPCGLQYRYSSFGNVKGNDETTNIHNEFIAGGPVKGSYITGQVNNALAIPKKRVIIYPEGTNQKGTMGNEAQFYLVDSLFEQFSLTRNSSILNQAINANNAISAVNNIDINQKLVNQIYGVYLVDDSLVTMAQKQDLMNLSWLCPFTDGLAVYQARGLIHTWDDSTFYYNPCEINAPQASNGSRISHGSNEDGHIINASVYPNPSAGTLHINTNSKDCIFEVYDVMGKMLMVQKLNDSETKIDVSSLNSGTYFYKISHNESVVKQDKLMITK